MGPALRARMAYVMRRVLFVSKPIAPPFHDGSKCIVRDLASALTRSRATVLSTPSAPPLPGPVDIEALYPGPGSFAPAWADNARVLRRLLTGAHADLWHFFFAPNPLSSAAARVAMAVRRVPTVQTVASTPRSFDHVAPLLFGARIVVVSQWMYDRLAERGIARSRLACIPPAVRIAPVAAEALASLRANLQIPDGAPVLTYPGDIDRSQGAGIVAAAVPEVLSRVGDAHVVFACRKKTQRAHEAERALRRQLQAHTDRVRFAGELPSLLPLLATSQVVLFPVDDLYGKVDLPIALLEAMALGVPIVAADRGPLPEIAGAIFVSPAAPDVAKAALRLLQDPALRADLAAQGQSAARTRHDPHAVAAAYEAVYDDVEHGRTR